MKLPETSCFDKIFISKLLRAKEGGREKKIEGCLLRMSEILLIPRALDFCLTTCSFPVIPDEAEFNKHRRRGLENGSGVSLCIT